MLRSEAINEVITKDPFAFSRSDPSRMEMPGKGCNCKKSNCSKKYCECFRKGQGCGKSCNCVGCGNPFKEERILEMGERILEMGERRGRRGEL